MSAITAGPASALDQLAGDVAPPWAALRLEQERFNVVSGATLDLLGWFEVADDEGNIVRTIVYSFAYAAFKAGNVEIPPGSGTRYVAWAARADGRPGSAMGGVV